MKILVFINFQSFVCVTMIIFSLYFCVCSLRNECPLLEHLLLLQVLMYEMDCYRSSLFLFSFMTKHQYYWFSCVTQM